MRRPPLSLATLAVLLALTAASETVIPQRHAAFAQSPAPVTAAPEVPEGTVVRIQGTESMKGISEALKQKFEARFSGTKVKFSEKKFDDALKAVQDDKIDLAAIGRNLTAEEKAAGLSQTPVTRHKIAIVVGKDNKFPGDLTDVQFAQIFRGEITNWSELGGENKPIRLIDRVNSDTRRALETYPVFQSAPFQPGSTAESLDKENVEAMLRRLNEDGISYALLDQVVGKSDVRIVTLYGTPPTDSSYPFSQPLTYVYKTPANPTVQAFLGYATAPDVQPTLAGVAGTAAAPSSAEADQDANPESDVAQAPDADGTRTGVPKWLWLLSVPLLAILIWFLLKGLDRSDEGTVAAVGGAVAGSEENNQITLTPRGGQDAYVSWTIPEAQKQRVRKEEGGNQLALRLYDVTGLDFDRHPAHSVQQFECEETTQDMHLTVPQLDRDYIAELGYVTYQGRWCKLARSAAAHIPDMDAELEATNFVGETGFETVESSTDNSPLETGEPGLSGFEDSFRTGGTPLIVPPTEVPTTTNYSADPLDPIQPSMTAPDQPDMALAPESASEATLAGTAAETTAAGQRRVRKSQIVLVARTGQDAYAYWELLEHHKEIAKQHGGQTFILRICDVTGVNLEQQSPHSIQQFNCEETDRDRHITVPDKGDYVAEIGYLAKNGRWLRIARSATVTIPTNEA